jgi:toxin ParE1/3/4
MRLIVDACAWRDLDDIGRWIARSNPSAARRVLAHLLKSIEQLGDFPFLARPGRVAGTFELVVAGMPYIIVFERWTRSRTIVVVAIVHAARRQH